MAPNDCFTCLRLPEDALSILGHCDGAVIPADLLAQHFWFNREDFRSDQILCRSCWTQLEGFHRFYKDVERNHGELQLPASSVKCELKEDDASEPVQLPPAEVKVETVDSSGSEEDQPSSGEEFKLDGSSDDECADSDGDAKPEEDQEEKPAATVKQKRKYTKRKKAGEPVEKKERKNIAYQVKSAQQLAEEDEIIKTHVQYTCETCGTSHPTFTKFQKHVLDDHGFTGYIVCCGRRYYKKVRLLEHVQLLENPDLFKCDICQKSFINNHGVRRHKQSMHLPDELKIHGCDRCSKRFAKESELAFHLKGHANLDSETVKCPECEKIFPTEALLKTHIKIRHTRPTDYICDVCAKGFYSKTEFLRHKVEHELSPAELRVQCDVCHQWLKNKVSWRKHYNRHKQGPAACDLCGHISPNQSALAGHKKRHRQREKGARYFCQDCGKGFCRAVSLREHMASHTGEALYSCSFCERTFNSNANMFSHRKKMHPKEWLEQKNAQQVALQGVAVGSVQ